MSPDNGGVYIIPSGVADGDESADERWVAPEPADEVIVGSLLEATGLDRETVEPLADHVDYEELRQLLNGDDEATLTFTIEGYDVTVDADGAVSVAG